MGGLALVPSAYALLNRKNLPAFATLSLCATAAHSLIVASLLLAGVEQCGNITLAYALGEIIFGLIFLDNKSILLPVGTALLQLYLILLKLDTTIKGSWSQVLLPWLILALITLVLVIMLAVYLLIRRCLLQSVNPLKSHLLWLTSLLLLSVVTTSLLPLFRTYLTSYVVSA